MSETKPKSKAAAVRMVVGSYTKDDQSTTARSLLTTHDLKPASTIMALDVSSKSPTEVAAVAAAYKEYQQAVSDHMQQMPSVANWMKARGLAVEVKSFKIAGFSEPQVTEV